MTILYTENGRDLPWEYAELILMRDVYHCTPEELDRQDPERARLHLELISVENKVKRFQASKSTTR